MQKWLKRIVVGLLLVLLIVFLYFWERFNGAYNLYHLSGKFIELAGKDVPEMDLRLTGVLTKANQMDSLTAHLNYQKDQIFKFHLSRNEQQYAILSDSMATLVATTKPALLISGKGNELLKSNPLILMKEILENHPQLAPLLKINWSKRLLFSIWVLLKSDFHYEKFNQNLYQVIDFPQLKMKPALSFWYQTKGLNSLRLTGLDSTQSLAFTLDFKDSNFLDINIDTLSSKKIVVQQHELNRAIYRGAVRTSGILLEKILPPVPIAEDKSIKNGQLTFIDKNRVLIAQGTPRELGEIHGALLKPEVQKMVDATLYTMCWVYTLDKEVWYIDELRKAYQRLEPYIPAKYQEEMAGLAAATGLPVEEIKLTNVFPELFHCSGFALFGKATADGTLYHGRVLDYITEMGLQFHAVVFIYKPDNFNAFANVGYAGFIGSVSGMNEHQVAFGEMGGRGEGDWDGMPMGFLMREGLECAQNLDQALKIFQDNPRTCEYFYVISDGKIPDARGLATTPKKFELVYPNRAHALLPYPMEDAVLLSAGSRYEKLVEKVKENYGKFTVETAIRLMDRPVAMKSNLHNVLFIPQSQEFWVANAGARKPACQQPYTRYSLSELMKRLPD
ncbi:hypothetical protein JW964_26860 [candidate division KSB1 bacterium]|nr:hypothetical protein [candidate division KSB1 bacterium]